MPVDLVTSFRFLGNAQPALRAAALGALHDLVVPGGYLIVNNHRNQHSLHNALLRLRRRGEGEDLGLGKLEQLLSGAGFEPVATHGIGLWVIRNRLRTRRVLDSRVGRQLERLSNLPGAPRFCPDMVVVARRR